MGKGRSGRNFKVGVLVSGTAEWVQGSVEKQTAPLDDHVSPRYGRCTVARAPHMRAGRPRAVRVCNLNEGLGEAARRVARARAHMLACVA